VSEWSVIFTPRGTQKRLVNRGTEWYVMRESRILEVRTYSIADTVSDVELATFPYAEHKYLAIPA
jgi:hypothetical protein